MEKVINYFNNEKAMAGLNNMATRLNELEYGIYKRNSPKHYGAKHEEHLW